MKPVLIDNWKEAHKFWSVRLSLLGSTLLSAFFAFPEAAVQAWNMVPSELKSFLPPELVKWIPILILFSAVFARILKQPELQDDNKRPGKCKESN